jgi:23S rRNA pseudouridine2605 synthase
MATKKKTKSAKPPAKGAPKAKRTALPAKKPTAKTAKKRANVAAAAAKKRAPAARKTPSKSKEPLLKAGKRAVKVKEAPGYRIGDPVLDPIGDVSSGEGRAYLGDVEVLAKADMEVPEAEAKSDAQVLQQPRGKVERLQKILSQAGIASRRRAEEMIVAGRVMVNGQVVTQLGSKADPASDHIRVDGKLIHGAERHRYFVLNKPRGFVTTVSDPEGRPTVMQFFAKMHERLYPVGRLDYLSEGLLLMTNDGELANLLTKAGSGVEKTYLVKVAGQPTEEQLARLRGGVAIERGEAGSERVHTAPARIRQVRTGGNPWFEVVLTEGRNRELRKMFAAIAHFAEKIRRVGYGPLALDVESGKSRELSADEVSALRLTAEGKMKPRRIRTDQMLPKEAGLAAEKQKRFVDRRGREGGWRKRGGQRQFGRPQGRLDRAEGKRDRGDERFGQKKQQEGMRAELAGRGFDRSRRGEGRQSARGERPGWQREERGPKKDWGPREREFGGQNRRQGFGGAERGEFHGGPRREPSKGRFEGAGQRDRGEKQFGGAQRRPFKPRGERPQGGRGDRSQFVRGERPPFAPRAEGKRRFEGGGKGFGKGAKFGAKPGGSGKFRGQGGRGRKFGGSRPGAARGGWKRG